MIIALCGYARSGKDTVAEIIKEIDPTFEIKKFSGKLKVIAGLLTGIDPHHFESQEFKEKNLNGWDMTARELMQRLGTDAIRDGLHKDAWVNALFCNYHQGNKWAITDCRFVNEAIAVKEFGGQIIRVHRPGVGPVNNHQSETELDNWDFDFEIHNDGLIDDLRDAVEEMMWVLNISKKV